MIKAHRLYMLNPHRQKVSDPIADGKLSASYRRGSSIRAVRHSHSILFSSPCWSIGAPQGRKDTMGMVLLGSRILADRSDSFIFFCPISWPILFVVYGDLVFSSYRHYIIAPWTNPTTTRILRRRILFVIGNSYAAYYSYTRILFDCFCFIRCVLFDAAGFDPVSRLWSLDLR